MSDSLLIDHQSIHIDHLYAQSIQNNKIIDKQNLNNQLQKHKNPQHLIQELQKYISLRSKDLSPEEFKVNFYDLIYLLIKYSIKTNSKDILDVCLELHDLSLYFSHQIKTFILNNVALYHKHNIDYEKATKILKEALKFIDEEQYIEQKGLTYLNLQDLLFIQGQHYQSLEAMTTSTILFFELIIKNKNIEGGDYHRQIQLFCISLYNLACFELYYNNWKSSVVYFQESLKIGLNHLSKETMIIEKIKKISTEHQARKGLPKGQQLPQSQQQLYVEKCLPHLKNFWIRFVQLRETYWNEGLLLKQSNIHPYRTMLAKRPDSAQKTYKKIPSPHLRNYSITFQKFETPTKKHARHLRTVSSIEIDEEGENKQDKKKLAAKEQPNEKSNIKKELNYIILLRQKNISDEIMNTHDDDCNCFICAKLFKLTVDFLPIVKKAKLDFPVIGQTTPKMGRLCVGFEKKEHYLIYAFQYFIKKSKESDLEVEEYLHRIDLSHLVYNQQYDINSKIFFNLKSKVLNININQDILIITSKNEEWPAKFIQKIAGRSEIQKISSEGIQGFVQVLNSSFSPHHILIYGINEWKIANNKGLIYSYIDCLENKLILAFEKIEELPFQQLKTQKFVHFFDIYELKNIFIVYDNKVLQNILVIFIKWVSQRLDIDYKGGYLTYKGEWLHVKKDELQSLKCNSQLIDINNSKIKYIVLPYGDAHQKCINIFQNYLKKFKQRNAKKKLISIQCNKIWKVIFSTTSILNGQKMRMTFFERFITPTGFFVTIECLNQKKYRSKDMKYIHATMSIEQPLMLEIIQQTNPWQYFNINYSINTISLSTLIVKQQQIFNSLTVYFQRNLRNKKFSIRIFSKNFDHSIYLNANIFEILLNELDVSKHLLINIDEGYFWYAPPKIIYELQNLANKLKIQNKKKSLEFLRHISEKIIKERSNEVKIQKLESDLKELQRQLEQCKLNHQEKENNQINFCQSSHTSKSDYIQLEKQFEEQKLTLQEASQYKNLYLDLQKKMDQDQKDYEKQIKNLTRESQNYQKIIHEKEQNLTQINTKCEQEHVEKKLFQDLEMKFNIKYWLTTNLEVEMQRFEYHRMKSAYIALVARFHDYCWECLHHKIIPKNLGCLNVDLIRKIQKKCKQMRYKKLKQGVQFGEKWLFWQVFETYQYYTKFCNKFWFQIAELESNKDIKMAQCIHLTMPATWQKYILLRKPEWWFFVCLNFQNNNKKSIKDLFKFFDINAQMKIFRLKQQFKIYVSIITIQIIFRNIQKKMYYQRLEKNMIKINTIFYLKKQYCLSFGFDIKAVDNSFQSLRFEGFQRGKNRHWKLQIRQGEPLLFKFLQSKKNLNFQIASQSKINYKIYYKLIVIISSNMIENNYNVEIYINGQLENLMSQVPGIQLPYVIEVQGGVIQNPFATTNYLSQAEILEFNQKKIQEITITPDDSINYQYFEPLLTNLERIVKMCLIISPRVQEQSQIPLFCIHHLLSTQQIESSEQFIIEFQRFMNILNQYQIYLDSNYILLLAKQLKAYKEFNVTSQAIQAILFESPSDIQLQNIAVLKIKNLTEGFHFKYITKNSEKIIKVQCIIYDKLMINLQKLMYPALQYQNLFQATDNSHLQKMTITTIRSKCSETPCPHYQTGKNKSECSLNYRYDDFCEIVNKNFPTIQISESCIQPQKKDQFDIYISSITNQTELTKIIKKITNKSDKLEKDIEVEKNLILLSQKNISVENFDKTFCIKMLPVFDKISFLISNIN